MKTIKLVSVFLLFPIMTYAQVLETINGTYEIQKNNKNEVSFYRLIKPEKAYSEQSDFFKRILNISDNDEFKLYERGKDQLGIIFEHYHQYYKGIPVKDGVFVLHWNNGIIENANGNYIQTTELNVEPSLNEKEALMIWCKYLGVPYKDEFLDKTRFELMIVDLNEYNEKEAQSRIKLAYKIFPYLQLREYGLIGYIDAHSGMICFTEPIALDFSSDKTTGVARFKSNTSIPLPPASPSNSTFLTRYSGYEYNVNTENRDDRWYLEDWTRGQGIETRSLRNQNADANPFPPTYSLSKDNNSPWTVADFSEDYGDAALDVHWGLQRIYYFFKNRYGRQGWDSAGQKITAYVHAVLGSSGKDNASYYPDDEDEFIAFGDGEQIYKPLVALDVIAHEYAHGINDHTSAFGDTGMPRAFNEGLSDIWAAVIKRWNNAAQSYWHIGDSIMKFKKYLRNIEIPGDAYAFTQMTDTYGTISYDTTNDAYFRSGVLSHWFYFLCEGGTGTNGLGNSYKVYKTAIDSAAALIYFAESGHYLNGATDYPDLRTKMENASNVRFGANSFVSMQASNAWYAVGVGTQPQQLSITGSSTVCKFGTKFQINNCFSGSSITWTCYGNKMHLSSSTSNPTVAYADGAGTGGYVHATISCSPYPSIILTCDNITLNYSDPTISGSSLICSSGTTFTFSAVCSYDSIKWSKGSYLNITSGQGTPSCRFVATGIGSSSIYATIYIGGTSQTYSRSVWAGKPILNSISGPNPPINYKGYTGQPYTFWTSPFRDANSLSDYLWMVAPPYLNWYFQYQYYDWATIVFNDPYDYYQVMTRATNTCGMTEWVNKQVAIQGYYFSISPNPASEEVSVTVTTGNTDDATMDTEVPGFDVQISDLSGTIYYSEKKSGLFFTLPISNLKNGSYLIIISYDKQKVTIPLIVQH